MGRYYNVNLTEHTCDCGRYQETKYPCVHAIAAASKFDLPSEIFAGLFSPIDKMENIIRAYENSIVVPPNHMVMPNEVERIEPSLHFEKEFRGPGRPLKNKRIKSVVKSVKVKLEQFVTLVLQPRKALLRRPTPR